VWVVVQGSACSKAHARVGVIVCGWLQGSKVSGSAASIVHRSELTGGGVDSSSRAPSCVDGRSSVRMWSAVDKATETEDQDDTDNDDVPLSALLHSSCRPQHDPAQVHTYSQCTILILGGSVTEWLACWTQAQKGLGSNHNRDALGLQQS